MTKSIHDYADGKRRVLALIEARTNRTGSIRPGMAEPCWEWGGTTVRGGYGQFRLHGLKFYVHRASLEAHTGERIPDGLKAIHACDNPPCANPAHLNAGTQSQNMQECSDRGRHTQGRKTHCPKGHPYDEDNTSEQQKGRRCRTCHNATCRDQYARKAGGGK
ncbi:HNH endonuclease [Streptomyces olivochromogenes]|uniref:HNH endonuclease n=1 Tax=Streptomyces olivochromogenes TaxID=1963 RepID=UPI0036A03CDF